MFRFLDGRGRMTESNTEFELAPGQIAASRVVVVDDEPLITQALSVFFDVELGIEAMCFNDPHQALEACLTNDVDMVISDFVMPGMNGIELLARLRQERPQVTRVLLTGYADKQSAIEAINRARLFQYIEKPWENERLKHVVINAVTQRALVRMVSEKVAALQAAEDEMQGLFSELARTFC